MATKYSKQHLALVLRIIKRDAVAAAQDAKQLWNAYNIGLCDFQLNRKQYDALGDLTTYTERAVIAVKKIKGGR